MYSYTSRSDCGTSRNATTSTASWTTTASGGGSTGNSTAALFSSSYSSTGTFSYNNVATNTDDPGGSGAATASFSGSTSTDNAGWTNREAHQGGQTDATFAWSTNPGTTLTTSSSTSYSVTGTWSTYQFGVVTGSQLTTYPYGTKTFTVATTVPRYNYTTTLIGGTKLTTTGVTAGIPWTTWSTTDTTVSAVSLMTGNSTWTNGIDFFQNTIFVVEPHEVVWALKAGSTAPTSGYLSNIADSYTADFTLYQSQMTTSNSYPMTTVTSVSFGTETLTLGQSDTFTVGTVTDYPDETYFSTAHQRYLGTFELEPYVVARQGDMVSTTVTSRGTFTNQVVTNSADYVSYKGTSTDMMTSTVTTVTTTFADNGIVEDANGLPFTYESRDAETPPEVYTGGARTVTFLSTVQTSSTFKTFSYRPRQSYLLSNQWQGAGVSATEYSFTHSTVTNEANYNVYLNPTGAQGLVPFHTAGRQGNVYRGFTVAMDAALQPFAFWLGYWFNYVPNVERGVSAICSVSGKLMTFFPIAYSDSPDYAIEYSATASFVTNSTSTVASGNVVVMAVGVSSFTRDENYEKAFVSAVGSGQVTVGLVSAVATGGMTGVDMNQYFYDTVGAGGMQRVSDQLMTRIASTGQHQYTIISNNGGSTSGVTTRTVTESTAIPTSVLQVESVERTWRKSSIQDYITAGSASLWPQGVVVILPRFAGGGNDLKLDPYNYLL